MDERRHEDFEDAKAKFDEAAHNHLGKLKKKQQAKIGLDGIAQECASYNPYNSKHLKSCIADALESEEFQRRNNIIDGSTSVTVACEVIT